MASIGLKANCKLKATNGSLKLCKINKVASAVALPYKRSDSIRLYTSFLDYLYIYIYMISSLKQL